MSVEIAPQAVSIVEDGLARRTNPTPLLEQLASIHADRGDAAALESVARQLVVHNPPAAEGLYYLATSRYLHGDHRQALDLAREATGKNPRHSRALNLTAVILVALGRLEEARQALLASMQADPRDPAAYTNLGLLELQMFNAEAAAGWFAEALTIDPRSGPALEGLAEALERQGHRARAQRLRAAHRATPEGA